MLPLSPPSIFADCGRHPSLPVFETDSDITLVPHLSQNKILGLLSGPRGSLAQAAASAN